MLIGAEILTAEEALACGYLPRWWRPRRSTRRRQPAPRLARLAPVTQPVSKEGLRRLLQQNPPDAQDLIRAPTAAKISGKA